MRNANAGERIPVVEIRSDPRRGINQECRSCHVIQAVPAKGEWTTTLPEQAQAMADQIWGRVDADGDGSVTKEQYLALRMGPRPQQ